jgi:hypothetical protein
MDLLDKSIIPLPSLVFGDSLNLSPRKEKRETLEATALLLLLELE